jgi:hypothetical protein
MNFIDGIVVKSDNYRQLSKLRWRGVAMYCPRCGHQPISDAIRFCSYCGFKLGVVKASLSDDDEIRVMEPSSTTPAPPPPPSPPRQRDINIGVTLMFIGALLAACSPAAVSFPDEKEEPSYS